MEMDGQMKTEYRKLLIRLAQTACEDENYYVGGYVGSFQKACGFFYPGYEILIQYIVDDEFVSRPAYGISPAEQDLLCTLEWRIARPISVIDKLIRIEDPEHLTIFDAERKRIAALSESADASSTSDPEPPEQT